MILVTCQSADLGGNQGSELLFTLRAAVQAFPGDDDLAFSLRCVLFLIRAGAAAAAQDDQQIQSRCIERNKPHILPAGSAIPYLSGQGREIDLRVTGAAEFKRYINIAPALH